MERLSTTRRVRLDPGRRRGRARGLAVAVAVGAGFGVLGDSTVQAFIPPADRTMRAIAEVNRASGRSRAIQLELTMRVGDREPVARGELVSHPTGLARLELKGFSGRIERYLLSGRELMASRDGRLLDAPRPLLQPFFLLQPASETTLRAALETFGVISDAIGLAPCGDEDCFVIGDPRLAAPLPQPSVETDSGGLDDALVDPLAGNDATDFAEGEGSGASPSPRGRLQPPEAERLEGPSLGLPPDSEGTGEPAGSAGPASAAGPGEQPAIPADSLLPRLWVDTEELEVRRIDRARGEFVILGPVVRFEDLEIPAWFEIHEPGAEPVRFEVDGALAVNASPKAFSRAWLTGPGSASTPDPGDSAPEPREERPEEASSPEVP